MSRSSRSTRVAREATPRQLTDPREMRALAHPVRIALLEALTREGPLTATEAADLLGESPANCSFHLRTLARYGFVEEAPGAAGRARPWRRVSLGQSFSDFQPDPATSAAAQLLSGMATERSFQRISTYARTMGSFAPQWREAAFADDVLVYLTADELATIGEEILQILTRYDGRTLDRENRPPGSQPVQLAAFGTPLPPTPSGN